MARGPLRKPREYYEARRLRRMDGTPLKQIAAKLGVSVSSVHGWTRDIELTDEQRSRNLARPGQAARVLAEGRRRQARRVRLKYQLEGRRRARDGDPVHASGCMLYWAEGSKDRSRVQLCNSDGELVRFFCRFLRTEFGVGPEDFRLSLNFYTGNGVSTRDIERHWLEALDLPRNSFNKHTINALPTSTSGRRRHRLPYGVCKVAIRRSMPIVQHIYGAIQDYIGSDEPRWLE
jgi:hypothetical protein